MATPATTVSSSSSLLQLWELPDVLIFRVISFVAAPTRRAAVICHQLAPVCRDAYRRFLVEDHDKDNDDTPEALGIWHSVLKEDYGVKSAHDGTDATCERRRSCKRLRRSPLHRVRDAHRSIQLHTEIAFTHVTEMINASQKSSRLSKTRVCKILNEYGPHLRINQRVSSSGGLFLVEICRARHVQESMVRSCVQELVEHYGAAVNGRTAESKGCSETALCVAAARGMPTVVAYLLQQGADPTAVSTGRFRLHMQATKSLKCTDKTPLQFATAMRQAELEAGASERQLRDLDACIRLLQRRSDFDSSSPSSTHARTKKG